MEEQ
jgi:hypothetical protein